MSSWNMRRTSSFGLSLSVCGAVAALAVGPARADDGVTVPADPTAIVAAVAAAVPSMPEPQGPAAPQLPATPEPETTVIPPVSAHSTARDTARSRRRRPAAADLDRADSTTRDDRCTARCTSRCDPGRARPRTAAGPGCLRPRRRRLILVIPPLIIQIVLRLRVANTRLRPSSGTGIGTAQTDEATPAVPAPPAGATTIVLNWHWSCAEPPPTLDVAGVTICVSCNIAISVRVGSPGNTGDLAQTIAAQTAATATGIAQTIQTALQAAPPAAAPLPPAPPAVIPPAVYRPPCCRSP